MALGFVRSLDVLGQVAALVGHVAAFVALEVERLRMGEHVFGEVVSHSEASLADLAKVVFLLGVHGHVDLELGHRAEATIAYLAHALEYILVDLLVHVQRRVGGEFLCAHVALEQALLGVYAAQVVRDDALA